MTKILFVCLGNICRSPMAEFVFKYLINEKGMTNKFIIDSAATSNEEVRNSIHYGTRQKLQQEEIPFSEHKARQIIKQDYQNYDYIIGMETSNIRNIKRIVGEDYENKIYRLLDFSKNPRDIADPWYTGNFDITYNDILEGCKSLLKFILEREK